jgi:hypothetical protein
MKKLKGKSKKLKERLKLTSIKKLSASLLPVGLFLSPSSVALCLCV